LGQGYLFSEPVDSVGAGKLLPQENGMLFEATMDLTDSRDILHAQEIQ
jgi:hypothetical protein